MVRRLMTWIQNLIIKLAVSVNISFFSTGRTITFSKKAGIWSRLPKINIHFVYFDSHTYEFIIITKQYCSIRTHILQVHVIHRCISAIISCHSGDDACNHFTVNSVVVNRCNICCQTLFTSSFSGLNWCKKGIILGLTLNSMTSHSFDNNFSISLVRGVLGWNEWSRLEVVKILVSEYFNGVCLPCCYVRLVLL